MKEKLEAYASKKAEVDKAMVDLSNMEANLRKKEEELKAKEEAQAVVTKMHDESRAQILKDQVAVAEKDIRLQGKLDSVSVREKALSDRESAFKKMMEIWDGTQDMQDKRTEALNKLAEKLKAQETDLSEKYTKFKSLMHG
jgi:hypothetical protein